MVQSRASTRHRIGAAVAAIAGLVGSQAGATEGQGSAYPHGAEGWAAGVLPPPGSYVIDYASTYHADRLVDGMGRDAVPDFRVKSFANTLRLVLVTERKVLGGHLASHVLVPLVDLEVSAAGRSEHRRGLGDIIVNPVIIGWHADKLHVTAGMDIFLPTGRYGRSRLANLGRNALTFEPAVGVTYLDPEGPDISAKLMYAVATRNRATGYRSGDEIHVDFTAGWNFKAMSLGVAGYYDRQVTDDRRDGQVVGAGNRGEVFALGPTFKRQVGRVPVMVTWQRELRARNRPKGDKVWLKVVWPLARP